MPTALGTWIWCPQWVAKESHTHFLFTLTGKTSRQSNWTPRVFHPFACTDDPVRNQTQCQQISGCQSAELWPFEPTVLLLAARCTPLLSLQRCYTTLTLTNIFCWEMISNQKIHSSSLTVLLHIGQLLSFKAASPLWFRKITMSCNLKFQDMSSLRLTKPRWFPELCFLSSYISNIHSCTGTVATRHQSTLRNSTVVKQRERLSHRISLCRSRLANLPVKAAPASPACSSQIPLQLLPHIPIPCLSSHLQLHWHFYSLLTLADLFHCRIFSHSIPYALYCFLPLFGFQKWAKNAPSQPTPKGSRPLLAMISPPY